MDHAGDVAWRLARAYAKHNDGGDSISVPLIPDGTDGHEYRTLIIRANGAPGPFRVTVRAIDYADLTEAEDYAERADGSWNNEDSRGR